MSNLIAIFIGVVIGTVLGNCLWTLVILPYLDSKLPGRKYE